MVHVSATVGAPGWHLATVADPEGSALGQPRPHSEGRWLIQNPANVPGLGSLTLEVVCDGDVFPPGCELTVHLEFVGAGPADDTIQLPPVEVAGLRRRDLVTIRSARPNVVVSLPREEDGSVEADEPTVVSTSAGHALAEVRKTLDIRFVPPAESINIVIAVDGSASMRSLAESGDLEQVVDSIHGVSQVLSRGKTFRTGLIGERVAWNSSRSGADSEPDGSSPGVLAAHALLEAGASIGVTLSHPDLRPLTTEENTMTFLITDGLPADLVSISADGQVEGEARHLVVLTDERPADLAGLLDPVSATIWPLGLRPESPDYRPTIFSLLKSCFDPQSEYFRRLFP